MQDSRVTAEFSVTPTNEGPVSSPSQQIINQKGPQWVDDAESNKVAVNYRRAQTGSDLERVAVISLKNADNVVSEVSIPASDPRINGRAYVLANGPVNTGLAFANDQTTPAVISFYFTDASGRDFGQGSFTLDAKRNFAAFVNQPPFNLQSELEGSFTFSSSVPVGVNALRGFTNERGEFLMTTLPVGAVQAENDRSFSVLPQFVYGLGWSTQVVLVNPTDDPLSGTVQFFDAVSSVEMTAPYAIAPRSIFRIVAADSTTDLHFGYVLVTAANGTSAPVGISILSLFNDGVTVTETGFQPASLQTEFQTYFRIQGSVRSVVAIANPSGLVAHTTVQLTGSDNLTTSLTASIDIPAGGYISQFIDELFPGLVDGFQGKLSINSTQPVAATGLRVRNNDRGDVLITSVPPTNDTLSSPDSELVFPLVVKGGGYSTEFIGENK